MAGADLHRPRSSIVAKLSAMLSSQCAVCHTWAKHRICPQCVERYAPLTQRCQRCALPLATAAAQCGGCLRDPPPFMRSYTAFDYVYPWDQLLQRFKFRAALELAPVFAQQMLATWIEQSAASPHYVVPVPMSNEG